MITINKKTVRSTVTPSAGGTQSNELQAAIKSVTSSTTVGAVFLYDTSADSDGGKWRSKCKGLSWFDEASSTTRSARSEFPAMALIVADSVSGVTIYDLDDPAMPMWMVFNGLSGNYDTKMLWASGNAAGGGLFALNGRVLLGRTWVDFSSDEGGYHHTSAPKIYTGGIGDRNGTTLGGSSIYGAIADNTVNDISATILEGAEIGALGLPIPTVAVATAGGVSVIHPSGDVYNQTHTVYGNNQANSIFWDDKGGLSWASRGGNIYNLHLSNPLYATSSAAPDKIFYTLNNVGSYFPYLLGGTTPITARAGISGEGFASGSSNGLSLVKQNTGNLEESAVTHINSTYNSGYQIGDIRFAGLAGSRTADRSVKANTLAMTGSVTAGVVATDAELGAYSGFSATDYLSQAHDADFDFGTTDFSVMFWVKYSSASGGEYLLKRDTTGGTSNKFGIYTGGSNFTVYAGTESDLSALDVDDGSWHQIGLVRTGGKLYTLEDGKYGASGVASVSTVSNGSAVLHIGQSTDGTSPATNASLSLLRISKTAPSPKQIADIYAAEKPLFQAGAKCLLQSGNNAVNGLAYDKSTSLLTVAQNITSAVPGATIFRGLEQVATFDGKDYDAWSGYSIHDVSTAGGVSVYSRQAGTGGTILDLPALDVRAELNEGESKIPDDGKLHFSASILGATATNIAHIPVNENEAVFVSANVRANEYGGNGERAFYQLKSIYRQDIGGNIVLDDEISTLGSETTASMVAKFDSNTPKGAIEIEVTGVALKQIVWTASVEVQRISEKLYER